MSKIAGIRKSEIDKILEGTSNSYYNEIICKPNSKNAEKDTPEYLNTIDVGIILKVKENFMPIFVQSNRYGFGHLETKPFLNNRELEKIMNNYEVL